MSSTTSPSSPNGRLLQTSISAGRVRLAGPCSAGTVTAVSSLRKPKLCLPFPRTRLCGLRSARAIRNRVADVDGSKIGVAATTSSHCLPGCRSSSNPCAAKSHLASLEHAPQSSPIVAPPAVPASPEGGLDGRNRTSPTWPSRPIHPPPNPLDLRTLGHRLPQHRVEVGGLRLDQFLLLDSGEDLGDGHASAVRLEKVRYDLFDGETPGGHQTWLAPGNYMEFNQFLLGVPLPDSSGIGVLESGFQ